MKLALLADVHANLEALTACLDDAQARGAEAFAFLGDLVGYGADPGAVVDLAAAYAERGAIAVRGNHDEAVLDERRGGMNVDAEEAIRWTRTRLGDRHRQFLASLPLVARLGDALFVHGSAARPEEYEYVYDAARAAESLAAAGATYVFSGHVHEPALYYAGGSAWAGAFRPAPGVPVRVPSHRRWLAIPGAVGQPRDGYRAACYAIAELDRALLTFFRVPYDWTAAVAKVRAAGLPPSLARRLENGE
ncbi:metallophosphoesterase [Anaeromyxobacter sp. Fw109-5]|uniref:metallophosphoesterase family protein n=1 Tax=Anaeromyxobacter sp. (strain Fw109-5) TaxID=404589 RepID=UPI000314AFC1|nr:metallophosphoesterase family protein [Anaeromyxobacter sp. Fw109-5]